MSFSSRLFLLIVVTLGCLISLAAYFAPHDSRLPWLTEVITQLRGGRVSAVWILPGCLLGLMADLWAAVWFGFCLAAWLLGTWIAGHNGIGVGIARKLSYGDVLTGWPVAMLFAFYTAFFVVRRIDRHRIFA
jgi:hypothetical protein